MAQTHGSESVPADSDVDVFASVRAAMLEDTPPTTPLRTKKRLRTQADIDGSDLEPDGPPGISRPPAALLTNAAMDATPAAMTTGSANLVAFARRHGLRKGLRGEQLADVESFAMNDSGARDVKIYTQQLSLERKLDSIITSMPPWTPSKELQINAHHYVVAVMLSSKISAYKGQTPVNHVLDIIRTLRFDIPVGIERNVANWKKIVKVVSTEFTNIRASFKKLLRNSTKGINPSTHHTIYNLTTALIKNTKCTVSVPLCARVALMRAIYMLPENRGNCFWDKIDDELTKLRHDADGSERKWIKGLRRFLEQDRQKHGRDDNEVDDLEDEVDEQQQEVDDILEGRVHAQVGDGGSTVGNASTEA
ncbi:uncharacterized protein B0H18DRAFT_1124091 [Fomitopsis serialis]|uniref:uncharacterized protein n=1 Tax=Fomitopsis serialis TaxID=139415 RepID=UPI0020085EA0|nr:uncharacterized protein B0H18DRAFT_1124091 [Neoantrodia serialis]KAH9916677.1 hypothetical protein B0H18DRAFT_1124091 [Neoantrodia serialis]